MKRFLGILLASGVLFAFTPNGVAGVFLSAYDRIMLAVESHDEKALKEMIVKGININAQNPSGQTALCTVLRRQDAQGYKMLFEIGRASCRERV